MTIPDSSTYTVHLPFDRSSSEPVLTLVFAKNDDLYKFGIAICSSKDQFNKKLGRRIAYGRMLTCNPDTIDQISSVVDRWLINLCRSRFYGFAICTGIDEDIRLTFETLKDRMKNKTNHE